MVACKALPHRPRQLLDQVGRERRNEIWDGGLRRSRSPSGEDEIAWTDERGDDG
jgi:hypothetical protein